MGFTSRARFLAVVLLLGQVAWGSWARDTNPEITVLVMNTAKIPQATIRRAEAEARHIFRAAGIETEWIDCFRVQTCHHLLGPREFVLNIVSDGKTSTDLVFGVAFLGPEGLGKYSDVFFNRMEAAYASSGRNIARLLGTVAAHELGHLLLGSHAHSNAGIMTATWKEETLRRLDMGGLLFSREQAELMKSRIERRETLSAGTASGTK